MLGKIEDKRREWQRIRWLEGVTNSVDMSLSDGEAWHAAVHGVTESDMTWPRNRSNKVIFNNKYLSKI